MISLAAGTKVFLACRPVDLRNGFAERQRVRLPMRAGQRSLNLSNAVAVMAFNWSFVPPRGTFSIDLRQHALLLRRAWFLVVALLISVQLQALIQK